MAELDEYLDALAGELGRIGAKRVILLGEEDARREEELKFGLARRRLMVLTPPAAAREWIFALAERAASAEGAAVQDLEQFAQIMQDGLEHGVDALLVAHESFDHLLDVCKIGAPRIAAKHADK